MKDYTKYEQAFGQGDIATWHGKRVIIREVIMDEDGAYSYGVEGIDPLPVTASSDIELTLEIPQDELEQA